MAGDALKPQTTLKNYAIKRVLGRGSFGITYLAEQLDDRVVVAIKEYFPTELAGRDADGTTVNASQRPTEPGEDFQSGLNKFLEESRVLGSLKSPHIVRVVDTFELNGTAYMVMQYEEGGTLARYLHDQQKPMDEGQILSIFVPMLKGLRTIHAKWLLHRDIKPENIYIRKDGSPLLIDFGTARHALSVKHGGMTEYLTPGFAPPEQYDRHDDHGPWTDIYAVGATMYYCVTRIVPPEGRRRIVGEDPVMPAVQAAPAIYDRALLKIIDWMMASDVKARPQSVDEVLEQLEDLRTQEQEEIKEGQEELAATMEQAERDKDAETGERAPAPADRTPSAASGAKTRASSAVDSTEKLDTARQVPPHSRSGWDLRKAWLFSGVAAALLVLTAGLLINLYGTGSSDRDDSQKAAKEQQSRADSSGTEAVLAEEESSADIDNPTPLQAPEIQGYGIREDITYYYTFYGGPGEITVTARGRNDATGSAVNVIIEKLNGTRLADINMGYQARLGTESTTFDLGRQEQLLMRVELDTSTVEYEVRLGGAVELH